MSRILVFGGCFDPIANHHLCVLKTVMERAASGQLSKTPSWSPNNLFHKPFMPFEEAWILPYNKDPHNIRELAPINLRIEMIELGLKDFDMSDYVQVSDFEEFFDIRCGRTKALLRFCKFYNQNDFTFLLGTDEAMNLRYWKGSRQLSRELKFITVNRPKGHQMVVKKKANYFSSVSDWYMYGGGRDNSYIGETLASSTVDGNYIRNSLTDNPETHEATLNNDVIFTESVSDFIRENNLYTGADNNEQVGL